MLYSSSRLLFMVLPKDIILKGSQERIILEQTLVECRNI